MADVRVMCVDRKNDNNPHEGITHLGGSRWHWTRGQVIDSIEAGTNSFHTFEDGKRADVVVVHGQNGKYVRTKREGAYTDTRATTRTERASSHEMAE